MIRALCRRYPRWATAFWTLFAAYQIWGLWAAWTYYPEMVRIAYGLFE